MKDGLGCCVGLEDLRLIIGRKSVKGCQLDQVHARSQLTVGAELGTNGQGDQGGTRRERTVR
jgi:hypothetical protein